MLCSTGQRSKVKCYSTRRVNATRGIATLPIVLALSIMIIAIIVGITAVTFNESFVSQGSVQSGKAMYYAEVGARDALVRIARNKNYSCDSPVLPTGCYSIDMVTSGCSMNDGCARVVVDTGTAPKIINVEGRVGGNIRKLQVNVTFDGSSNGEISSTSWQELTN